MKFLLKTVLYLYFCSCAYTVVAQSISVDDSRSAQYLVEDVLVKSACVTITSPNAKGDTFTVGAAKSYGEFVAGGNFPFSAGVVLSTWSAKNSENGLVAVDKATIGDSRWLGDPDLETALGISRDLTINATVLEFDFIAKTDFISFNYIFASNEYRDYFPCEFSDGFAFLIKEKGITGPYKNIAVLPNSITPVASTNVHPFIPPYNIPGTSKGGCPASNEIYFGGYNTNSSPINYYGQTKVLNAQTNVTAGVTYHIKLVIADYRNEEFDSAVFLEAGSFAPKINFGPDRNICYNDTTVLDTGIIAGATGYKWFKDGIEDTSQTGDTFTVSTAGTYSVEVTLAVGCVATGKVKVDYKNSIKESLSQCGDTNGNATFDLTKIYSYPNVNNTNKITYYSDFVGTPITNLTAYTSAADTVYARTTDLTGVCINFIEIKLNVLSNSTTVQTFTFCDNDGIEDGTRSFNLTNDVGPQITPSVTAPYFIEGYYANADEAANKQNNLLNNYTNTVGENIFARIENGINCYAIYEIQLNVITFTAINPSIITDVIINDFSGNNAVEIKTSGTGPFEYSLDGIVFQDKPLFTNVPAGEYIVYARDTTSCGLSSVQIYVLDYPRFFTPNGDGINDLWKIKNLGLYPKAVITIFDRYGKLLKQINATSLGWNGNYNGVALPADDYWFHIKLAEYKIIKGHFSLKR